MFRLYVSRLFSLREIEGLQHAICSVLDILFIILAKISKDELSGLPVLYQAMLSPAIKPIPVVAALTSWISYSRAPAIQVNAARVLSMLCIFADHSEPYLLGNAIGLGDKQIIQLRVSIENIIREESARNEDLFVAILNLLTSAAHFQPAFLAAMFASEAPTSSRMSENDAKDMLLVYVERSEILVKSHPRVLTSVLNFLKALCQEAAQYTDILDTMTTSKKFWEMLAASISMTTQMKAPSPGNLTDTEAQSFTYKYKCQSAGEVGNLIDNQKLESPNLQHVKNILLSWSKSSVLTELLKSSAACMYDIDIHLRAKIASSLFAVHMIAKLISGDAGSLSVSFIENMDALFSKLINLPAFSELFTLYSRHGYSEGTELRNLILNDLFYHLQGELEGRIIDPGPFKELSQFLIDSNLLQTHQKNFDDDILLDAKDLYLFDLVRLRQDMGLDTWDYSEWKASKEIAETLLFHLQNANSMLLLASSGLSVLRGLMMVLTLNESADEKSTTSGRLPKDLVLSCINHVCKEFRETVDLLIAASDASKGVLDFLAAQTELLLCLVRNMDGNMTVHTCNLLLQTCRFGLKTMSESRPLLGKVKLTMKFLLMLLILTVEYSCNFAPVAGAADTESVEAFGEVSNTCLGLLPSLCNCSKIPDHCILSITIIDLILRNILMPSTWIPVIKEHLQLQHVVVKLHEGRSSDSLPEILKFLLTLARVRGGAEMLLASGFLQSLRLLFAELSDTVLYPVYPIEKSTSSEKIEKPQYIWGLGVAVLTSIICSLGEGSLSADVVDNMMPYLFSEKAYMIAYYLSAPVFPSNDHDKKRARAQKRRTSLSALRETEHTLMLMCVLAKHKSSWVKAMKNMDSELRERSIHLLAFISRGNQCLRELSTQTAPFLCLPVHKEEFEYCTKSPFVCSKSGWFGLSPHGIQGINLSFESTKAAAIVVKDQATCADTATPSYFSDVVAIQIYKISFLLLRFLCLQADGAARRAEELGFVDLSCFPELPMPDILHGLQDQAIIIVTDICEANKSKQMQQETQDLCLLLLEVSDMALYLEFCVWKIYGIRPVLGRVEDFAKEVKSLLRVTEGHAPLQPSIKHLKQIIASLYPGLLQSEGIF
ncbi:hypothetical protein Ancab_028027 [Ancistrocladus abbreviatus]